VKYNTLLLANMQTALKKSETEVKEILVRDLLSLKEALDRKLTDKDNVKRTSKTHKLPNGQKYRVYLYTWRYRAGERRIYTCKVSMTSKNIATSLEQMATEIAEHHLLSIGT
jgi:flagellar motility protein MotE (MotC chaperone)